MAEYSTPANTPLNDQLVRDLRADFPILGTQVNGHPLVYLDSGATSQKPLQVLDAERDFYLHANSAVHRGAHTLAVEATDLFEDARATVARFVGATDKELVWTSNATEALNLIAYAIGNASQGIGGEKAEQFVLGEGDEIVTTEVEHHANLIPWQILAQRTGATLRHIPVTSDGQLDYEAAEQIVGQNTRVLAFTHVSNVTGAITDVPYMVALGIGALYGRAELLDALPPFLTGGSMITRVGLEDAEYMPAPIKFEAGTQRVSQTVAFAAAVRYLEHVGMSNVQAWEHELGQRLAAGVQQIEGVRLLGPADPARRAGLVSLAIDGVHPHDVGQLLDTWGIAVRVGHHCAQPLHKLSGVTASTRASAYLYNTTDDIEAFLAALAKVRPYFGL